MSAIHSHVYLCWARLMFVSILLTWVVNQNEQFQTFFIILNGKGGIRPYSHTDRKKIEPKFEVWESVNFIIVLITTPPHQPTYPQAILN